MDRESSEQRYEQASQLYREGKHAEALVILDELNAAYPTKKSILYARAQCLAALGREDEAREICEHLVATFNYPRAERLLAKLGPELPVEPQPDTESWTDDDAETPIKFSTERLAAGAPMGEEGAGPSTISTSDVPTTPTSPNSQIDDIAVPLRKRNRIKMLIATMVFVSMASATAVFLLRAGSGDVLLAPSVQHDVAEDTGTSSGTHSVLSIEEIREAGSYMTQGAMVVHTNDEDCFTYVAAILDSPNIAEDIDWSRDFVVCNKDGTPYEEKSGMGYMFWDLPENINGMKVFVDSTQYDTVSPSGIIGGLQVKHVTGAPIRGAYIPPPEKETSHEPMRIYLIIDAPGRLLAELALKFKDGEPVPFPEIGAEPAQTPASSAAPEATADIPLQTEGSSGAEQSQLPRGDIGASSGESETDIVDIRFRLELLSETPITTRGSGSARGGGSGLPTNARFKATLLDSNWKDGYRTAKEYTVNKGGRGLTLKAVDGAILNGKVVPAIPWPSDKTEQEITIPCPWPNWNETFVGESTVGFFLVDGKDECMSNVVTALVKFE